MWRYSLVLGLVCLGGIGLAQTQKHFRVESDRDYKSISLNYSTSSGICYLGAGNTDDALSVFSTRDIEDFNHRFNKNLNDGELDIDLKLEEKNTQSFSQSISSKMFDKSDETSNVWKVFLSEELPYDLDLKYGIGAAFIDLSGISVSKMKVQTGSADVNVNYLSSFANPIIMEEFFVKVDLGNVNIRQLYKTNAEQVIAEVGFGNLLLDLSEPVEQKCNVRASVGAGNLEILIPKDGSPILVKVKSSMLCDVRLTKSFREIEDDVFVNEDYREDADDLISFDVDVAMGNIIFKEKK